MVSALTLVARATPPSGLFMVRLGLAVDLLGWAFILALPRDTFGSSHAYDVLALFASERTWTVLTAGAGLFNAAALWLRRVRWQWPAAFLSALFQSALVVSFGMVQATGTFTHVVLLGFALWSMWAIADV